MSLWRSRGGREEKRREERFFPQKTRKEAEVLTARTPFGMTGSFLVVMELLSVTERRDGEENPSPTCDDGTWGTRRWALSS